MFLQILWQSCSLQAIIVLAISMITNLTKVCQSFHFQLIKKVYRTIEYNTMMKVEIGLTLSISGIYYFTSVKRQLH